MEANLELSVATMFRDANLRSVVPELRTEAGWERFNEIKKAAQMRTSDEHRRFEAEFPERLAKAREDIINKAGAAELHHPAPLATDRFDKSAIDRQAWRNVEMDHQNRLIAIKTEETDALTDLRYAIRNREGLRDRARDEFNQRVDRRLGSDRRQPGR